MKAPCFAYSPAHKLQGLCHPECMNVHAMTVGLSDRLPMFGTVRPSAYVWDQNIQL